VAAAWYFWMSEATAGGTEYYSLGGPAAAAAAGAAAGNIPPKPGIPPAAPPAAPAKGMGWRALRAAICLADGMKGLAARPTPASGGGTARTVAASRRARAKAVRPDIIFIELYEPD